MLLIGTWRVRLDQGRAALPASFQPATAAGLTLTRGFERCLQAFPSDAWQRLARRVSALPLTADAARTLRRLLFGAAVDFPPAPVGTLTIPNTLLTYAGLDALAIFVGCNAYFEIWSPEALGATVSTTDAQRLGVPAPNQLASLVASLASAATPAIL